MLCVLERMPAPTLDPAAQAVLDEVRAFSGVAELDRVVMARRATVPQALMKPYRKGER